jgi:thioredoxin
MKYTLFSIVLVISLWFSSCGATANDEQKSPEGNTLQTGSNSPGSLETRVPANVNEPLKITKAEFLSKVYDFEKNPSKWVYIGNKPCIVDFYADWCKPCKMVAPILADLSHTYSDQITVYKVNVDEERELAQFFGIQSIPTVLFCPVNGKPQMTQGALPKESFEKIVKEVLLSENIINK